MTDRENVIKGIRECLSHKPCSENGCPYEDECAVEQQNDPLLRDALTLLKEQEAVEPIETGFKVPVKVRFDYECICGAPMLKDQPFCMGCGRKVKWDA